MQPVTPRSILKSTVELVYNEPVFSKYDNETLETRVYTLASSGDFCQTEQFFAISTMDGDIKATDIIRVEKVDSARIVHEYAPIAISSDEGVEIPAELN